ncbi:MAG: hypothetical protein WAN48_12245 [Actinomycetes bacterium]
MRVYIPFTADRLAGLIESAVVGPAPFLAAAVTTSRRGAHPDADDEVLEFDATADAARRSLELLTQNPAAPFRRVVVVADVPDGVLSAVTDAEPVGWVSVDSELDLGRVAAFLVDGTDAASDVSTAVLTRAFDALDDLPLQWYAASELAALVSTTDP